jgi:UDP-3-O-[3-hydroxymyristoyl] glucosamine N-acyltransferase LpxD
VDGKQRNYQEGRMDEQNNNQQLRANDIANFLKKPLDGPNVLIDKPRSLSHAEPNSLLFAKKFTPEFTTTLNKLGEALALVVPEYEGHLSISHILTSTPRLDFARVLERFFAPPRKAGIADTAVVAPTAKLGKDIYVGPYSTIGDRVEIGDFTEIRDRVTIHDDTVIGSHCVIKSNTVIGEEGFGFEFEDDGTALRIQHLGRVVIADNVEIGALNVIARGTLDDTFIASGVKIDDHVFIAHNVYIGENSVVIAGAQISGSVKIGKNVWVSPQVSIINNITVGDDALLGIGAVVTKPVEANVIVSGNPARVMLRRYER